MLQTMDQISTMGCFFNHNTHTLYSSRNRLLFWEMAKAAVKR